jgi:4'-phosphopantetheinyl transferase
VIASVRWESPPALLELHDGEVHLWRACLNVRDEEADRLGKTLSPDEVARALVFVDLDTRRYYGVARGLLRRILGRYLRCSPERVSFGYGACGKPRLKSGSGPERVRFNVAHTGDLALYAVTGGSEVGVDVEQVRGDRDADAVAEQFFSAREAAALRRLSGQARADTFAAVWARKEACVKATGAGMSAPLELVDVPLCGTGIAGSVGVVLDGEPGWSLLDVPVGARHAAAVVARAPIMSLKLVDLDGEHQVTCSGRGTTD